MRGGKCNACKEAEEERGACGERTARTISRGVRREDLWVAFAYSEAKLVQLERCRTAMPPPKPEA